LLGPAAALLLSPAVAQEATTTRERTALPPKSANRMIQRDLLSVLEPVTSIHTGMFRQLRAVGTTTKPFGTEFDGLCRRDQVTLRYAATEAAASPEDAALRPYSVEAQPWFHLARLPRNISPNPKRDEGVWQSKCAAVGALDNDSWFMAQDARTAMQGVLMLDAAVKAVRSGTLKAEPCPNMIDDKKSTTCEAAILAAGDISKIDSVEACPSDADSLCYILDLASSTKLTIKGRPSDNSLAPSAITSIAVEQYIIVT
jgi:hypothetical protein